MDVEVPGSTNLVNVCDANLELKKKKKLLVANLSLNRLTVTII